MNYNNYLLVLNLDIQKGLVQRIIILYLKHWKCVRYLFVRIPNV